MSNDQFTLDTGRTVGITAFGDPLAERLVVLCAPSPGSGDFDPEPVATNTWGVHLIALDRPGYGASELLGPDAAVTVQVFADDIARRLELIDAAAGPSRRKDIIPVGVIGWGFGAAVALSLAGRHPDLVDKAVVIDPRTPKELRNEAAELTVDIPAARYAQGIDELASGLSSASRSPLQWLDIPPDDPMLEIPGVQNRIERMVSSSPEAGMKGLASDITAGQDMTWGDDLSEISASVSLVFSEEDPRRRADAHWLARHIPHATTIRAAGCGSLPIVGVWPSILDKVAPNHGQVPPSLRGGLFDDR